MNSFNVSIVFGISFILVGLIGFVPNPLLAPDGLFAVNAAHNMVHILTGMVFLLAMYIPDKSGLIIKAVGAGYVIVAIAGFLTTGDTLLGLVHINVADRWLHAGLAAGILATGYLLPKKQLVVA